MRKLIVAVFVVAFSAASALAQSQQAPTLRIVSEDGNKLPSDLLYGNTKVKPLRLRPGTNVPITIDDSDFYVQQQYVDFLSRFPDQSGFSFWQNDINQCGTDANCIAVHRVNVSAAFFLSIEFQSTGYLVYRLNKAAFGNLPGAPVPVRRETFMPDTRSIASGVVVGAQGWEALLEANKVAFTQSFVQRSQFASAYPTTQTPAQFVDALYANTGITPSATDRNTAIGEFGASAIDTSNTAARAKALRDVAENASFQQSEFNKAFVLMQYFGYLKRNPNDLPDSDYSGYTFWLSKLNQFNGDFNSAEMVKAFITSTEYRGRF
ncbi:MAG TPA: hypothetical protein VLJ61_14590 [Pyrinomonadaceae bacterium]|nr:hypothetical protein [Pyrinomonadaceae bacterium]